MVDAGLEREADALLAHAAPSIRLCPTHTTKPGEKAFRHTPETVPGLTAGAIAIAAGPTHNLALMADGSVQAWGQNQRGKLGDGTTRDRPVPVGVRRLDGATAISVGSTHSLALREDGSVVAWGSNTNAELCDGTRKHRRTPVAVRDLDAGVTAITAGRDNSLALREDGSVVGWGLGVVPYKLGFDNLPERPMPIPGLDAGVVAIAAAGSYWLALMADGSVLNWGAGVGQVRQASPTSPWVLDPPAPVAGLEGGVTAIATSTTHSLALMADGSVVAWGGYTGAYLGDGTPVRAPPEPVRGLGGGVVAIAAGDLRSHALKRDGSGFSWGTNSRGQLGDGTTTQRDNPVPLAGLGAELSAIAPGVALRRDGSVVSWGGERPAGDPEPEPDLPLASTRLGGRPDLPPSTSWPGFEEEPMAFVAQVNLADVSPLDERGVLPPGGLVSFFCAPSDLGEPGSWHVAYTDDASAVLRVELPEDLASEGRHAAVGLRAGAS